MKHLASPTDLSLTLAHLSQSARAEYEFRRKLIEPLLGMGRGANRKLHELSQATGLPYNTLRRWYDNARAQGLAALIDRRLAGPRFWQSEEAIGLPAADQLLVRQYCERDQRGTEAALRRLQQDWRAGRVTTTQPLDRRTGYPKGWSIENLRRYVSGGFALTAMRQGLGAAMSKHGPKVLTTRVGLWVGSHYLIDDVTRDLKVVLLHGRGGLARVQELGVMDLYSADRFAVHRRPQFTREDGTKDSLKEREMRYLVAAVLRGVGISPRGTEFVVEGGTAAIRRPLAEWLHRESNQLITVRGPGDLGKQQVLAGWKGAGGGNPRHKAALESHHNLLHNKSAHLPAPTGHDRNPPEWLHGIERDIEQVLDWIRTLPPEQALGLRFQTLEYYQALRILADLDLQIALRTEHDLEGWVECGHTTTEIREHPDSREWFTLQQVAQLPEEAQNQLALMAHAQRDLCIRARKLAPREVFSAGAAQLQRFPDHLIALMFCDRSLGDDLRQQKTVTREGTFEIDDKSIQPDTMIFDARLVESPDGAQFSLHERQSYSVVLNPFDLAQLWVFDPRGSYLGVAKRRTRVNQLDVAGIEQQLGHRSHVLANMLTPLRERHADASKLVAEIQENNRRIVSGQSVTPEDRARDRRVAAKIADGASFLTQDSKPNPSDEIADGSDFF